ncbi:MAG: hypothetical protein ACKVW3_10325 [Phycisphaerales bacterium]
MRTRVQTMVAAAGAAMALAGVARGQTAWSAAVNGSWFDGSKWSAGVPVAGTATTLGLAGAYAATLQNGAGNCGTLTISNPVAVVNIFDNAVLNVDGNIINSGLIQISGPGAPGNATRLAVAAANVNNSGSGTLRLAALGNGDNDTAYLTYTAAANTLTNFAGATIAGKGRIYTRITNLGTINADQSGAGLLFIDQTKINNGTITATGGGFAQFRSVALTQNVNGALLASNNSPIQINGSSVVGGTLNGAGTGPGVQYIGASTLDSVTLTNLNAVIDNSVVNVAAGGVVNNGTWTISDPAAPGNLTRIHAAANTTISGTGTIRLQGIAGGNGDNDSAYLSYTAAGNVLTNGVNHSIKGYGRVYTNLVNNGTVNADVAGKALLMIDQPKTNNGTMTASNGGVLAFRSVSVTGNPAAQVISSDAASPVQMINATMSGGGFTTSGTGVFQYFGANTLSNLTVNGTHQIIDNSTVNLNTNLVNNGNWLISTPAAPGNLTRLSANAAAVAISGTGTIRLQGISGGNGDNDSAYLAYGAAGNVLTLGANQQVLGYGRVYTNIVNNGTINADNTPNAGGPANKGIILQDQPKTNNATITSSNGGFWYVRGITLTNNGTLTSSNTSASGGGFENSTVVGGMISNISNQFFGTVGSVNMNGSTITPGSGVQINDNSALNTTGLTNNGTIRVSMPTAAGNFTRLQAAAATTTLGGTGTLRLQGVQGGNGDNDSAFLQYTAPANQLVNATTHTIAGYGRVYSNLVNNGTINADNTPNASGPASKGIFLQDQPKTNNATITSSNGGFWYARGTTVTNGPSGVMSSSNTTTSGGGFDNCTVVGGTLTNVASQFFGTVGITNLNGVTITSGSGVQVNDNSMMTTSGLTNNGTIAIQRVGGPGNLTRLRVTTNGATIGGTGTVRLNSVNNLASNDSAYIESGSPTTIAGVLGPSQTLAGIGRVYHNWTLQGRIDPGQTPTGSGEMQCSSGAITLAPTTQYDVQISGTPVSGNYDRITGNSVKNLAGSVTVAFQPSYVANAGDLFDIVSGPTVNGEFTTVTFQNVPTFIGGRPHVAYPAGAARVVMCYANCDGSSATPRLNVNDFTCFLNKFSAASVLPHAEQVANYANCDGSTTAPALNVNDFTCFLNKFATGCP